MEPLTKSADEINVASNTQAGKITGSQMTSSLSPKFPCSKFMFFPPSTLQKSEENKMNLITCTAE